MSNATGTDAIRRRKYLRPGADSIDKMHTPRSPEDIGRYFVLSVIHQAVHRVQMRVSVLVFEKAGRDWAWLMDTSKDSQEHRGWTMAEACADADIDLSYMQSMIRQQFDRNTLHKLDAAAKRSLDTGRYWEPLKDIDSRSPKYNKECA